MKTIVDQLEEIKFEICDKYCKVPDDARAEHDDDPDWITESDESPCQTCPLNRI